MTQTLTALTRESDSALAGQALGAAIRRGFNGAAADAVVVFASARHDYPRLLRALSDASGTRVIAGSSSAGEFTEHDRGEGFASVLALRSTSIRFAVSTGHPIDQDPRAAAEAVVRGFQGTQTPAPYRAALVMADALAGHTDALLEHMTLATGGNYMFFGGGAGDDARFQTTHVFAGDQALSNAVVALELLSTKPIGIGVAHGWSPASEGLRVTEVDGMRLIGLNGAPAVQAFDDHAAATGQTFDHSDPLPFFLHNIIGIVSNGQHRLRVPLGVNADGSVACAAAVPVGSIIHIMKTSEASAVQAAQRAATAALERLGGQRAAAALVFDCVATRLRLGHAFGAELDACAALLHPASYVGCNTYGQIARVEGQFSGFHNCTAVVCALPE